MNKFRLTIASFALLALAACSESNEDGMEDNGRTALTVSNTTIAGRTVTRATDNAWEAGDAIGITMLEAGSTATVTGNPLAGKYVTADGTGAFAPADKANTLYYPTQDKPVDVVAFYPYYK